jgi:hypothetical protein
MNIGDLPKFFGLPATNREFQEFLSNNGIEERPAFDPETGNPVELIEVPDSGLALEFIRPGAFVKKFGPVREDGDMIFSKIFIYLVREDDYAAYTGTWPSPFPTSMTPDECLASFGKPDRVRDENDDFGQPNSIEYTWDLVDGYSIFVRFIKVPLAARHVVVTPAKG